MALTTTESALKVPLMGCVVQLHIQLNPLKMSSALRLLHAIAVEVPEFHLQSIPFKVTSK